MYRWKEERKYYGLSVFIQGRFTEGRTCFQQMWMWRLCVLSSCHRTLVNIPSVSKHTNLKISCSFVQTKPNRSGEHEGVGVCVCVCTSWFVKSFPSNYWREAKSNNTGGLLASRSTCGKIYLFQSSADETVMPPRLRFIYTSQRRGKDDEQRWWQITFILLSVAEDAFTKETTVKTKICCCCFNACSTSDTGL